ncbi:MAG: hypothetical protein J6W74_01895 [Bacteroidales bacterium]|nr:hypothetical protein [Bacteroidales bacterium]
MKRIVTTLILAAISLSLAAQANITTRKYRLSDFRDKTLKVVLTGSEMMDAVTRDEVMSRWTLSPFEFCSPEEFASLLSSNAYYFLVQVEGMTRGEQEPGVTFLSVLRGGGADINSLEEVVNMPLKGSDSSSGREFVFYGALLDIIQDYILRAMDNEFDAYAGLSTYAIGLSPTRDMHIYMSRGDVEATVSPMEMEGIFSDTFVLCDEEDADAAFEEAVPGTLVSYVVAAINPRRGSRCYKMLIDPSTRQLRYIRRHKITNKAGRGFLLDDLKKLSKKR